MSEKLNIDMESAGEQIILPEQESGLETEAASVVQETSATKAQIERVDLSKVTPEQQAKLTIGEKLLLGVVLAISSLSATARAQANRTMPQIKDVSSHFTTSVEAPSAPRKIEDVKLGTGVVETPPVVRHAEDVKLGTGVVETPPVVRHAEDVKLGTGVVETPPVVRHAEDVKLGTGVVETPPVVRHAEDVKLGETFPGAPAK